ncbi:hypothetical protein LU631_02365 [Erwinia tracheiphila]|uniref:hypothetical protein n=1 Tax=Erwinia tracheiphila TaxID=65700 RepID=UPI0003349823|nr:hypothetical protein [Erwinia tracheiphila]EOS94685.1 hypothetical protein ETR_12378 [Erwinia tracheiphila PSU-1]UIA82735.1 hypothetical protein LU604_20045 [Erwinia tracheiphila]UIA88302.1 hypothetical protein LU631_02365 [Erwinia tracheiphila]UIA91318.1 hypothetical protein LU632_19555 [Erwinia tracheiphila]UIA96277.1 hypothetical protein LU633_23795 [Erwinia tracheiphila]
MLSMLPKVDTVRYALGKLPVVERERGQVTGSDYKKYLPLTRPNGNSDSRRTCHWLAP